MKKNRIDRESENNLPLDDINMLTEQTDTVESSAEKNEQKDFNETPNPVPEDDSKEYEERSAIKSNAQASEQKNTSAPDETKNAGAEKFEGDAPKSSGESFGGDTPDSPVPSKRSKHGEPLKNSFRSLYTLGKRKTDELLKRRVERMMKQDSALLEPLYTAEEKAVPTVLVRGGVDGWFLLWAILLICFGAVMNYSASSVYSYHEYGDSMYLFRRYLLYICGAAFVTFFFVWISTPRLWELIGILIYCGAIVLLLLVLLIGRTGGGAQRWLAIGGFTIQPSEVAKTGVVMVLSLYLSAHEKEVTSQTKWGGSFRHGVLVPGIIMGLIILLVMMEKHISGIMIIGMIGVAVMFIGGTRMKWLGMIGGVIGAAGVTLIACFDYAQERVLAWINLESDPLGSGWQTLQGLYAIGSGGLFGVGLGNSSQKYGYVSEPQNDFIFSIVCEELGFVGALLTILLFCCLVVRGFQIAAKAPNKFCALTVYGLSFKVALQAALNIAVVTNSMPNTGISLPFFSSGGTSLALQVLEIGIILSISRFSCQKKA